MSSKQKVFIVGPLDLALADMWNQSSFYTVASYITQADILCFQGGADVHPKLYGEEPLPITTPENARDEEDIEAYTRYPNMPKVGICRGGQFLNVMAGGEMWQDVNNHSYGHEVINLIDIPKSQYQRNHILDVTSDHHQMMIPSDLGTVITIAHKATEYKTATKDREHPQYDVEAVWYEHLNALCFQPHPEYNSRYATRAYFFTLMKYLIG